MSGRIQWNTGTIFRIQEVRSGEEKFRVWWVL